MTQRAHITVEDNGFTRITIPAKFDWRPGQHCFLRFTSFGFFQALSTHPFTICSSPSIKDGEPSELVFYIRHQTGFTAKLYDYACKQSDVSVPVLVDGPYGGANLQRYRDSDHLLVIAGGSGAGWCLPFIERFVRASLPTTGEVRGHNHRSSIGDMKESSSSVEPLERRASGPVSLRVILATRDIVSRTWFLRTVSELLEKYSTTATSSGVRVQVYLTGDAADEVHMAHSKPQDHVSPAQSISSTDKIEVPVKGHDGAVPGKEFEGRPRLSLVVAEEAAKVAEAGESLGVFVCGPDTMQNDVRNAVAEENRRILTGSKSGGVYLHSEHFSWA